MAKNCWITVWPMHCGRMTLQLIKRENCMRLHEALLQMVTETGKWQAGKGGEGVGQRTWQGAGSGSRVRGLAALQQLKFNSSSSCNQIEYNNNGRRSREEEGEG